MEQLRETNSKHFQKFCLVTKHFVIGKLCILKSFLALKNKMPIHFESITRK